MVYEEQISWGGGCIRNFGAHLGVHENMTIA